MRNKTNLFKICSIPFALLVSANALAECVPSPSNVPCMPTKKAEIFTGSALSKIMSITTNIVSKSAKMAIDMNQETSQITSAIMDANKGITSILLSNEQRLEKEESKIAQLRANARVSRMTRRMNQRILEKSGGLKADDIKEAKKAISSMGGSGTYVIGEGGAIVAPKKNQTGEKALNINGQKIVVNSVTTPDPGVKEAKIVKPKNVTDFVKQQYIQCAKNKLASMQSKTDKLKMEHDKNKESQETKEALENKGELAKKDVKENMVASTNSSMLAKGGADSATKFLSANNVSVSSNNPVEIKKEALKVFNKKVKEGKILPSGGVSAANFFNPMSYSKSVGASIVLTDGEDINGESQFFLDTFQTSAQYKAASAYQKNIISASSVENINPSKMSPNDAATYKSNYYSRLARLSLSKGLLNESINDRLGQVLGASKGDLDNSSQVLFEKKDGLSKIDRYSFRLNSYMNSVKNTDGDSIMDIKQATLDVMSFKNELLFAIYLKMEKIELAQAAILSTEVNSPSNVNYIKYLKK